MHPDILKVCWMHLHLMRSQKIMIQETYVDDSQTVMGVVVAGKY